MNNKLIVDDSECVYLNIFMRKCVDDDYKIANSKYGDGYIALDISTIATKEKYTYHYYNKDSCTVEYIIKSNNELILIHICKVTGYTYMNIINSLTIILNNIMNGFGNIEVCDIISDYIDNLIKSVT